MVATRFRLGTNPQRKRPASSLAASLNSTPPASLRFTDVEAGSDIDQDWASSFDLSEEDVGVPNNRPGSPIEGFENLRRPEALSTLISTRASSPAIGSEEFDEPETPSTSSNSLGQGSRGTSGGDYAVCKGCGGSGRGRAVFSVESLGRHEPVRWQKDAVQAEARVSMLAVDPRELSTWTLVDVPSRPIAVGDFISIRLREDGKSKPSIFRLAAVTAVRTDERHWREFVIQASVGEGAKAYLQVPWSWCARSAFERLDRWFRASSMPDTITPLDPATLSKSFPGPQCKSRIMLVKCNGPDADIELVEMRGDEWYAEPEPKEQC